MHGLIALNKHDQTVRCVSLNSNAINFFNILINDDWPQVLKGQG